MKVKIHRICLYLTLLLLITEILIAIYVQDDFVRPYVGDYLVVILIYCGIKTFFTLDVVKTALGVLFFSYFIEVLQSYNFVAIIGLQNSRIANVVLGNYFTWVDIAAYTLGVVTIIVFEKILKAGKAVTQIWKIL